MGNAHQLSINEKNLLSNLKFAFAGKESIVVELIQNARRAGATRVDVLVESLDEQTSTLTVIDDGCGIDNFSTLLTCAESGWDATTQMNENPFGMGFFSCLFASEHIRVESGTRFLDVPTADIVAQKIVRDGELSHPIRGTKVMLWKVAISHKRLKDKVCDVALGYELPISLNGESIRNPFAVVSRTGWIETPIGKIWLPEDPKLLSSNFDYYLQGVYMGTNTGYSQYQRNSINNSIIHLDARRFNGRMPDRDVLVDREESVEYIQNALAVVLRNRLSKLASSLDALTFVNSCWSLAKALKLDDLLNGMSYLPSTLCERIVDVPHSNQDYASWYEDTDQLITRRDIETGKILLVEKYSYLFDVDECEDDKDLNNSDFAAAMYVFAKGYLQINSRDLPARHWAHAHILTANEQTFTVEVVNPDAQAYFNGDYASFSVNVCDSYIIRYEDNEVRIHEEVLIIDGAAVVPLKADNSFSSLLYRFNNYCHDDDYQEAFFENDLGILTSLIASLRGAPPEKILHSVLSDSNWRLQPALMNQQLLLTTRLSEPKPMFNAVMECFNMKSILESMSNTLSGKVSIEELTFAFDKSIVEKNATNITIP